jgi:hypothetical protein
MAGRGLGVGSDLGVGVGRGVAVAVGVDVAVGARITSEPPVGEAVSFPYKIVPDPTMAAVGEFHEASP